MSQFNCTRKQVIQICECHPKSKILFCSKTNIANINTKLTYKIPKTNRVYHPSFSMSKQQTPINNNVEFNSVNKSKKMKISKIAITQHVLTEYFHWKCKEEEKKPSTTPTIVLSSLFYIRFLVIISFTSRLLSFLWFYIRTLHTRFFHELILKRKMQRKWTKIYHGMREVW